LAKTGLPPIWWGYPFKEIRAVKEERLAVSGRGRDKKGGWQYI